MLLMRYSVPAGRRLRREVAGNLSTYINNLVGSPSNESGDHASKLTVFWQVAKPVATSSSVSRIIAENELPLDQFPEQGAPRIKEVAT